MNAKHIHFPGESNLKTACGIRHTVEMGSIYEVTCVNCLKSTTYRQHIPPSEWGAPPEEKPPASPYLSPPSKPDPFEKVELRVTLFLPRYILDAIEALASPFSSTDKVVEAFLRREAGKHLRANARQRRRAALRPRVDAQK